VLEFIGTIVLTPGTPIRLVIALAAMANQRYDTIIISQRIANTGFILIGGFGMTGVATMICAIPPASASSVPFAEISISSSTDRSNGIIPEYITVDGTVAETIQISGIKY
jgi:hypothetical protein